MSLKELPEEYAPHGTLLPRDLLALRPCNKSSAAAVQRSIQGDDRFEKMIFDALAEPRNIESEAHLRWRRARLVAFAPPARAPRAAIRHYRNGRRSAEVVPLPLRRHGRTLSVRARARCYRRWCARRRANIETADVEQLSMQISQACPLLEVVKLPCNGGAVEGYAAAFPNLRCLEFFRMATGPRSGKSNFTAPSTRRPKNDFVHGQVHVIRPRFDRIELALRTCRAPGKLISIFAS